MCMISSFGLIFFKAYNPWFAVSQCQAIHARSIFPCQDTPDIKSTYEFNLQSPLPALASGLRIDDHIGSTSVSDAMSSETKTYKFMQMIPIPSYLFAIASGYGFQIDTLMVLC